MEKMKDEMNDTLIFGFVLKLVIVLKLFVKR